jgi:hypothetical protein
MAKITFDIEDELDDKFRKAIAMRKGIRKGVIGQVLDEAIRAWIKDKEKTEK